MEDQTSVHDEAEDGTDTVHAEVKLNVDSWELKRSQLSKGLGQEGEIDGVRFIIQSLCDHPVLDRKEERTLTDALTESRSAFLACLETFPFAQTTQGKEGSCDPVAAFGMYARLKELLHTKEQECPAAEAVLGEPISVAKNRFESMKKLYKKFEHNRAELLRHNQRLVLAIAKRFRGMGIPLEDLFGYGNAGLIRAADKFEPARGNKFGTYATWWIFQSISKALTDSSRLIRLSPDTVSLGYAMRREERQFIHEVHRKPSDSELAERMSIPKERLVRLRKELRRPVSLSAPTRKSDSGDDGELMEMLDGDSTGEAPDIVEKNEIKHLVDGAFERLQGKAGISTQDILAFRLFRGLDDGQPRTIADIAAIIGKKNGPVRQMLNKVQRALSHDKELRSFAGVKDNDSFSV